MDLLNVPAATTSSGSTKVLIQEGNTLKSRTASDLVGGLTSSKYRADFCLIDFQGSAAGIPASYNDDPFSDPADFSVFRTEFVPTNFTIGYWCTNGINTAAVSGVVGVALQYTTTTPPTGGWNDVSGSTADGLGKSSAFVWANSTVSITGSPSAVFWRLKYVNTLKDSGNQDIDATWTVKSLTLSLWN